MATSGEDDRVYQVGEELGQSSAGRVQWKKAHKKGKFSKDPKMIEKRRKRGKLV